MTNKKKEAIRQSEKILLLYRLSYYFLSLCDIAPGRFCRPLPSPLGYAAAFTYLTL